VLFPRRGKIKIAPDAVPGVKAFTTPPARPVGDVDPSRFSKKDRKNFMVIGSRSAFECVAILEYLYEVSEVEMDTFNSYYKSLEEISKMLFSMIWKLESN